MASSCEATDQRARDQAIIIMSNVQSSPVQAERDDKPGTEAVGSSLALGVGRWASLGCV